MQNEERFYLAALALCPGIGCKTLHKLLEQEPSPQKLWQLPAEAFIAEKLLGEKTAQALQAFRCKEVNLPEKIAALCREVRVQVCGIRDDAYPVLLREIYDAPVVLYYRGTLQAEAERVAMVGSRYNTTYGEGIAKRFAEFLARAGLTIVSGAARGIDTCAHTGALKGGRTVAVLGCGVDVVYPPENERLLQKIVSTGGAVLSEYVPGTQPFSAFFPARNRIISGLARSTIVVEAAGRSGSLITADLAVSQGREVFAVPGTIYAKMSQGCNKLIQHGAKLVQRPEEILEDLRLGGIVPQCTVNAVQAKRKLQLPPEEQTVYDVLSSEQDMTMDDILLKLTDLNPSKLAIILLQLEIKGLILKNNAQAYRRAEGE